MIKDTKSFDVNSEEYTEGTPQEQADMQKRLGKIETNLAGSWKDLSTVKQNLWNKLHQVKNNVQSLAQTMPHKKSNTKPVQFAQKV